MATFVLGIATQMCGLPPARVNGRPKLLPKGKLNISAKLLYATLLFDTLTTITSLVIGILSFLSIIHLPAACSFALIGYSGGIILIWLILTDVTKGDTIKLFKDLLQGTSNRKYKRPSP